MSQSYDWLFIRNNLQQTEPGAQEPSDKSPDIITRSSQASSDDLNEFVTGYNQDYSQDVDYRGENYIYVRAKNLNTDEGNRAIGSVSLWYCLGDHLNNKNRWIRLSTESGDNTVIIQAKGQEVAVTETPFIMANVAPPAQDTPYRLIAFITDKAHPEPSGQNLKEAIIKAGNAAYRTLPVPTPPPVKADGFGWVSNLKLNNTDNIKVTVQLSATQFDADAEMYFIFDTPDADGNVISIGKTKLVPNQVYGTEAMLPKNYASKVSAYYFADKTDGGQLKATFTLQILEQHKTGPIITGKLLEQFAVSLTQVSKP
ncbi:hypothetical protein GTO89_02570 [Heliobacterium gestii]|uniref:Uncharacterized protein n=1 Tax=Heliomicrobium gestii TaxID=2699 RepID=A0A845L5L0_HELGE|nr:hypothetical protein [Heliomicrobium gestii]MBM7865667.1 hypothetical protein [Heliomicrobium gestii]MZP41917.1 hypothetical protein [Heliomicrobium gestii]